MKDEDEDDEIQAIEEIDKATFDKYLREKFGGALPDTEIDNYLDDRFRQYDLPHGQKRKLSVSEMLRDAENHK